MMEEPPIMPSQGGREQDLEAAHGPHGDGEQKKSSRSEQVEDPEAVHGEQTSSVEAPPKEFMVKKAKKRWHDACLDLSVVEARFVLLQALNAHLEAVLPFVDFGLAQCDDWSFGALLSRWRSLILMKLKM